jgi:hypothetical protein
MQRSTANQPLPPLVDQDVGDDGRARRSERATRRVIAGREFLELLPARRRSEQRPQFLLSFLEAMLRSHQSSLSNRKREVSFGADWDWQQWAASDRRFIHRLSGQFQQNRSSKLSGLLRSSGAIRQRLTFPGAASSSCGGVRSLERRMFRQQVQSSLGISSREGIDTYRANRKPDCASERSMLFPPLYLVNPVSSDSLALNKDGVFHHGVLFVCEKETRFTSLEYNRSE